jgi:heptosyltransferase-2
VQEAPETIVVRLPNHLGDVCMALPALHLLAAARLQLLLAGRPWVEALLAAEKWPFCPLRGSLWADARRLRVAAADCGAHRALLLPNSFGSALSCRLAGLQPAGFATDGRGLLLAQRVPQPSETHEVERFFAAARGALAAWGKPTPATQPPARLNLRLREADRAAARAALSAAGVAGPFALLAPVARGTHRGQPKHWPHFAALPAALAARGLHALAAPPADEAAATQAALPGAMLLPPLPLGVFAALAAQARIVIANDSGTSHVAAAVGVPQVTIIGVTDARRTGPWSTQAQTAGRDGAWPGVAQVLAAIERALAAARPA